MTDTDGSFFGDFDADDAWDNAKADPEQVARKLNKIMQDLGALIGVEIPAYDDLPPQEHDNLLFVSGRVVQWIADNGPAEAARLAEKTHEFSRLMGRSIQPWAALSEEEQQIAKDIGAMVSDWLIRQGAWQ